MTTHRAIAVLAAVILSVATMAGYGQRCSNRTTVGRYLVVCNGYLSPGPNGPLLPAKELGIGNGDDEGTFSASGTVSVGGQILHQTVTGTEQLNPDCTGTITYKQTINGQPGPDFTDTFFVSDHGDRIDGLSTAAGSVFSCVLTRVGRLDRREE